MLPRPRTFDEAFERSRQLNAQASQPINAAQTAGQFLPEQTRQRLSPANQVNEQLSMMKTPHDRKMDSQRQERNFGRTELDRVQFAKQWVERNAAGIKQPFSGVDIRNGNGKAFDDTLANDIQSFDPGTRAAIMQGKREITQAVANVLSGTSMQDWNTDDLNAAINNIDAVKKWGPLLEGFTQDIVRKSLSPEMQSKLKAGDMTDASFAEWKKAHPMSMLTDDGSTLSDFGKRELATPEGQREYEAAIEQDPSISSEEKKNLINDFKTIGTWSADVVRRMDENISPRIEQEARRQFEQDVNAPKFDVDPKTGSVIQRPLTPEQQMIQQVRFQQKTDEMQIAANRSASDETLKRYPELNKDFFTGASGKLEKRPNALPTQQEVQSFVERENEEFDRRGVKNQRYRIVEMPNGTFEAQLYTVQEPSPFANKSQSKTWQSLDQRQQQNILQRSGEAKQLLLNLIGEGNKLDEALRDMSKGDGVIKMMYENVSKLRSDDDTFEITPRASVTGQKPTKEVVDRYVDYYGDEGLAQKAMKLNGWKVED